MEASNQKKYIIIGGDVNVSLYQGDRWQVMDMFCRQFQLSIANGQDTQDDEENMDDEENRIILSCHLNN